MVFLEMDRDLRDNSISANDVKVMKQDTYNGAEGSCKV